MVNVSFDTHFEKTIKKIHDAVIKERLIKQIIRIIDNPKIGKPMKYARKSTRELYVPPFRLSYYYSEKENCIIFLDFYHKDIQ